MGGRVGGGWVVFTEIKDRFEPINSRGSWGSLRPRTGATDHARRSVSPCPGPEAITGARGPGTLVLLSSGGSTVDKRKTAADN